MLKTNFNISNLNVKLILFSMNAVSHFATYNVVISVETLFLN